MIERNGGAIRTVAWKEIFPWLCIFKTFKLAIGFRALAMSALAVLLTATGWAIFGHAFSAADSTAWLKPYAGCPWITLTDMVPDQPDLLGGPPQKFAKPDLSEKTTGEKDAKAIPAKDAEPIVSPAPDKSAGAKAALAPAAAAESNSRFLHEPLTGSWMFLSQPLLNGFGLKVTFGNLLCLICCGLWSLAVWAFFGAAITRIAAVQLAANERITWGAALRYACSKYLAYFFAPLGPLVGIALSVIPVLLFAWMLRFGFGAMVAGFLWPVFLIFGLIITLLLLGLIFGWPLMWPTISTEGTDSFDALSRSYAYVFQRPLHYLFYVVVAVIFGWLGWIFVKNFAGAVVWTTYWAASWDASAARIQAIIDMKTVDGDPLTGMSCAGAWLIHFWTGLAKLLAVGFMFSYFWNANSAIYLLLRRNVDATEMDEVSLDADEGEAKFGLPKIVLDDAGAPEVEEKAAAKPAQGEEKAPETTPGALDEPKPPSA
jgi:hypothetical protein